MIVAIYIIMHTVLSYICIKWINLYFLCQNEMSRIQLESFVIWYKLSFHEVQYIVIIWLLWATILLIISTQHVIMMMVILNNILCHWCVLLYAEKVTCGKDFANGNLPA